MPDNSTISPLPLGEGPGARAVARPEASESLHPSRIDLRPPAVFVATRLACVCSIRLHEHRVLPNLSQRGRHDIAAAPVQMPLMLAMFLFGMFAIHVKNQFANSRARLTPGFRRVHATVAAAAALLLAVLLPTMLIWLADLRSVGLVALMVFLFGAIFCSVVMQSALL